MSPGDDRTRAREWVNEQLDQLDRLRNANPRDPSFKMWRQNTLTVLQRVWPGQSERSERFRRVVFSPSMPRPTGQQNREWFTRGCNEASGFLRSLLEEIDSVGLGAADAAPTPSGEAAPGFTMGEDVLDLGDSAAVEPEPDWHEASIPKFPVKLSQPGASAEKDGPDSGIHDGLMPLDAGAGAPGLRPMALGVPAEAPPPARAPMSQMPPELPPSNVPASQREIELPVAPPKPAPAPPVAPPEPAPAPVAEEPKRAARPAKPKKSAPRGTKLKNMLGLGDFDAMAAEVPAPMPDIPEAPAPVAADPIEAPAPETASGGNVSDFLANSPVLGLQGRPVQRGGDVTPFQDPDAVALSTIASELGRLGVPEGTREDLRAHLDELARQMDGGHPEWDRLRAVISASMAYPPLARRVLPVLLPWLERAA